MDDELEMAQLRIALGQLRHEYARALKLGDDRLAQMKGDRAKALRWRDRLVSALTVCRSAARVIESSAYQGVSDEDSDLETSVRNWQTAERAHMQRAQLTAQLAGRAPAPMDLTAYGAPHLDET